MKGKFITPALMIVVVILMLAASAACADVTVSINDGEASAHATLEAAVTAAIDNEIITGLSDITSIEVTAGDVASADWEYIRTNKGNLTALTTLAVTEGVSSAADLPGNFMWKHTAIQSVSIARVENVNYTAFENCYSIKTANFPAAKYFGQSAFKECRELTSLALPAAPPTFSGSGWFDGCPSPRNLTLVDEGGNPLEGKALNDAIDAYKANDGYDQNTGLWQGWTLPARATVNISGEINGVEYGYVNLQQMIEAAIKYATISSVSDITSIEVTAGVVTSADWDYIKAKKDELSVLTTLIVGDAVTTVADIPEQLLVDNTSLKTVSIAKVAVVGQYSFVRCTALERASFPQATNFGWGVFIDCAALNDVNLPLATILGGYMFDSCNALSQASFPSVTEIGQYAFKDCAALTSLSLPAATPALDFGGWFDGCPAERRLMLVDENGAPLTGDALYNAIKAYEANIGYDTSTGLWRGWTLPARPQITLRINDGIASTHAGLEAAVTAAIDSGVISALSDITSIKVTQGDVIVPDWEYIKTNRGSLTGLTTLTVEDAVASVAPIPEDFLRENASIKTVSIAKVTAIGQNAFFRCYALESASFPQAAQIGKSALQYCIMLNNAYFPAATVLGGSSFAYCSALVEASFPKAANIGVNAFLMCSKLTRASFPKLSSIGARAFEDCPALTSLSLSAAPPTLLDNMGWFDNCPSPRYLTPVDENGNVLTGAALDNAIAAYDGQDADGMWEGWTLAVQPPYIKSLINGLEYANVDLAAAVRAAINGGNISELSDITSIRFTLGDIKATDLAYIKENRSDLTALATLAVDGSVTSVAPIPADFMRQNKSIVSVSIAKTTEIGQYAFSACTMLESASFPQATHIGNGAFYECSALKDANFPAATTLGEFSFDSCNALVEARFPSVTDIGTGAFQSCGGLTSASFPNVERMNSSALSRCTKLASLSLPAAPPEMIGELWFNNCPSPRYLALVDANGNPLSRTALNNAIPAYRSDSGYDIRTRLWHGWTIPEMTKIMVSINDRTASSHADLEAAIGASGVSLSDITSIEVTGGYVASEDWEYINTNKGNLSGLTTLTVEDAVSMVAPLPQFFLHRNTSIKTVSIAKAIEIGKYAFVDCTALESASFPQATQISADAFNGCSALNNVYFPAATILGESVFATCYALVDVSFPRVADIGIDAFHSCGELKSASFPKAERIGNGAFYNCRLLSSLSLPAAPPTLNGENWFNNCPSTRYLTLVDENGNPLEGEALDSAIDAYKADTGYDYSTGLWRGWALIERSYLTVRINGTVYANMDNLEAAIVASSLSPSAITSIEVTRGYITSEDWEYIKTNRGNLSGLTTFTVEDTVTSVAPIPNDFLSENISIKTVSIAKATAIGYNAFYGCSALQSASFPQATYIGDEAFYECSALESASFPLVAEIGQYAFYQCYVLESASFPQATHIGNSAFSRCSALKVANFPAATNLGKLSFNNCQDLSEANFPNVTDIDLGAFILCEGLKSASFPKVKRIFERAFLICTALSALSFPAAPPTLINTGWFDDCPSPRFLTLVDANGNPLADAALNSAIAAYKANSGYDPTTRLWHGWTLNGVAIGDANNDGDINNRDVVTILRWLLNQPFNPTPDQVTRGDIDGDGDVTKADAQTLIKTIAGMGND